MMNGIFKQAKLENVPIPEVKDRNYPDTEKAEKKQEKIETSEDRKKDENIATEEAMEKIVHTAKYFNRRIHLEVEEDLNMMIVKVIDSETDEVIRQIPPEELVELSKNARDLKGLLIDKEG